MSDKTWDLVIYGDGAGAVTAAVQARRMGHSAVVVSPTGRLGGLTSSGLGWTDFGRPETLGGLAREYYRAVFDYYQEDSAWEVERRDAFRNVGQHNYPAFDPETRLATVFEPKVAAAIFDRMAHDSGVEVECGRLHLREGAVVRDGRVESIRIEGGRRIAGRMFLDASYEGDLLAAAGVPFVVGREANAEFSETSNGMQFAQGRKNQLPPGIDPYIRPGDPSSGLLPGLEMDDGCNEEDGAGDRRLQAYCYRMVLTDAPENRVPIDCPDDYDAADYELLFRAIEAGMRPPFFKLDLMPNRKTDSNNTGGISTDFIGGNYGDGWDWTTLGHTAREHLAETHKRWQLGLVWTLQNHQRVPATIRDFYSPWGLPADEFPETGHWPAQIYVREGRRMRSDIVMTERHCRNEITVDDPIAMGSYTLDSHHVRRVVRNGMVQNEGDVQSRIDRPYGISYRAILPPADTVVNLAVPWALSATHIAFGSIRMEPVFMMLGQSAATAACLALDQGVSLPELHYPILKTRLIADGQRLSVADASNSPAAP